MLEKIFILMSCLCIPPIIFLAVWQYRTKHKANSVHEEWANYQIAVSNGDITSMNTYAMKLVWNPYVELKQLREIASDITPFLESHAELAELENILYSRKLIAYRGQ